MVILHFEVQELPYLHVTSYPLLYCSPCPFLFTPVYMSLFIGLIKLWSLHSLSFHQSPVQCWLIDDLYEGLQVKVTGDWSSWVTDFEQSLGENLTVSFNNESIHQMYSTVGHIAQWARIPKNLAKNRFHEIKQLRRNLFPFVLTSSLVIAHAWTSLCLHIGHVCTAG